jgi:hypothetical protein
MSYVGLPASMKKCSSLASLNLKYCENLTCTTFYVAVQRKPLMPLHVVPHRDKHQGQRALNAQPQEIKLVGLHEPWQQSEPWVL